MVGAVGDRDIFLAPACRGAQADTDARAAGGGAHDAREGDRAIHAPLMLVARAEIENLDRIALAVALAGDQDRRVADIMLFDRDAIFQLDCPEAAGFLAVPMLVVEQDGKDGVAVDPRHAGPDHAPGAVDQGGCLAVSDRPEVEITLVSGQDMVAGIDDVRPPSFMRMVDAGQMIAATPCAR